MRSDKYARVLEGIKGHKGAATVDAILSTVLTGSIPDLPGRVIGEIANIRHNAYIEGRSRGLDICDNCVWIPDPAADDGGQLIPLAVLRAIKIAKTTKTNIMHTDNPRHSYQWHTIYSDPECTQVVRDGWRATEMTEAWYKETTYETSYTVDFTEKF
jgi:hypothetical protein